MITNKPEQPSKCYSYPCTLEMSGRGYERKNIKTKTSSKNHIQQTLKNEYNDEETNNFGFELHQLGIYGICEKCGDKWPENQICPGEKDLCDLTFKRTNTGWVSKICFV